MSFRHLSIQTKSFIVLFLLAVFGSLLSVVVTNMDWQLKKQQNKNTVVKPNITDKETTPVQEKVAVPEVPLVSTETWKTYNNSEFKFSFKYDPAWTIKNPKKQGSYYIFEIDPGKKYYNFKIYVSETDYYAMTGFPTQDMNIGGQSGKNAEDLLYATKTEKYFYTFDIDRSIALQPEFKTLVSTVEFQ